MMSEERLSTIEELFNKPHPRRFKMLEPLPVSGLRLRIRSLTEGEVTAYQAKTLASSGTGLKKSRLEDANRRLISLCVVDADGNRMISDAQVGKLMDWDSADTQFLYNECVAHAGLIVGDIEGLVKNSDATPVED